MLLAVVPGHSEFELLLRGGRTLRFRVDVDMGRLAGIVAAPVIVDVSESTHSKVLPGNGNSGVMVEIRVEAPSTPGPFEYLVRIASDQPLVKSYGLKVCGRVRSKIAIQPSHVFLGELDANSGFSQNIAVRHRFGDVVRIDKIVASPLVKIEQSLVEGTSSAIIVHIHNAQRLEPGPMVADILLGIGTEQVRVRVSGIVVGNTNDERNGK